MVVPLTVPLAQVVAAASGTAAFLRASVVLGNPAVAAGTREYAMIETATGTVLADLVRHGTGAPPSSPLTTALIGSGASLMLARDRRLIGLVLLAAGGALLWREALAARREQDVSLRRARPAPPASDLAPSPRAGASVAAA